MNEAMKQLIKQTVLEMVRDGELQVDVYVGHEWGEKQLVVDIGTNLGEVGYEVLATHKRDFNQ